MSFLEEKEEKNGVRLIHYASGDGSLTLAFQCKHNNLISDIKVTNRDVDAFLKREKMMGWKTTYQNGGFRLYLPVERIGTDEVLFRGKSFRYTKVHEQCFHIFDEEGHETKNSTVMGAIMFFINHEKELCES